MDPFDLIAHYFKQNPAAQSIGTPAALQALTTTLIGIVAPLPLYVVPDPARQQMSGKSAAARRPRALKYARFLTRRPDYATKIDLPAQTYQAVLDKDRLLDAMAFTFTYLREQVDHALLLLAAQVGDRIHLIIRHLHRLSTSDDLLSDEEAHTLMAFADTLTESRDKLLRDHRNQLGRARAQASHQQQLDQAQQQPSFQSLLSRLISDAQAGKDLSWALSSEAQTQDPNHQAARPLSDG